MANGTLDFKFESEDHVIFSCTVIPTKTNRENRENLERILKKKGVRIFKDIHVSGHAAREDLRDLIKLVKPKHVIPAHGEPQMIKALGELVVEMGYKDVHLMKNGDKITL